VLGYILGDFFTNSSCHPANKQGEQIGQMFVYWVVVVFIWAVFKKGNS
jgi:hypothetical protein